MWSAASSEVSDGSSENNARLMIAAVVRTASAATSIGPAAQR